MSSPFTSTFAPQVTTAGQAATDAYLGMWEAFDQAGRPPQADPDHPQLARFAADQALRTLMDGLSSMREEGLVFSGTVDFSPVITVLDSGTAQIEDCADSSDSAMVRVDGEPFVDEPGGFRSIVATVSDFGDDTWKVTDFAVREVGSCLR